MIREFYNYMEGSGFQANKEDEGKKMFENEVNRRLTSNPKPTPQPLIMEGHTDRVENLKTTPKEIDIEKEAESFVNNLLGQGKEVTAMELGSKQPTDKDLIEALKTIVEIKEKERDNWASMCIRKQEKIEFLESEVQRLLAENIRLMEIVGSGIRS